MSVDVIVVGAGFAGLSAAHALIAQGRSVQVLEARTRVGGRVEPAVLADGIRVDAGGQFLCDDMPAVVALVRRYGKTLVRAPVEGEFRVQPPTDEAQRWQIYEEAQALRRRVRLIDPADPAVAGLSVADWLTGQGTSAAGAGGFRSMIEGLWCRPLEKVPLWYLASSERRIINTRSELEYYLDETIHSLADDMGRDLGDRLRLGAPVRSIATTRAGVQVQAGDDKISAGRAIVAVPPVMASRIGFEPGLPPPLRAALSVWASGTVIKALVRYARPFWRASGANGMVMWREPAGLFCCDVSREGLGPALVVFIGGPLAVSWRAMSRQALEATILDRLTVALGADAGNAIEISLRDWTDDAWSGGGYSDTISTMATSEAEDIIRAGAGPIQFACSEISPSFPGYIEGAIIAGRAAAQRVSDST